MTQIDKKLAEQLNHLLTICNDGKYGFDVAAQNIKSDDLKALLYNYSIDREEFAHALKHEVRKLAGEPEKGGGPLGVLHRAWMDVKNALSANDDKAILEACLTGERAAVKAYKEVLEKALLPADTRSLVALQHIRIEETLRKIETLLAK